MTGFEVIKHAKTGATGKLYLLLRSLLYSVGKEWGYLISLMTY
jgi:hypothetical protein